jgi:cell division protein FtsB
MKKDADKGLAALIRRPRSRAVRYLLVLIGCVLVVDALVGDKGVMQLLKKRQQVEALNRAVAAAQAENARLSERAHRLKHDPSAIEDVARRDLGLIKKGEKMFIIRDVGPADVRAGEK